MRTMIKKTFWSWVADLWRGLMHRAPMWPVQEYYRCPACRREYAVLWEVRRPIPATPDDIRQLVEEHHPYYEVAPYYVAMEKGHGSPSATTRRIQAGFDIDIYGATTNTGLALRPDYALGYAILQKNAETVSHDINDCCSIEAIPFFSSFFLDKEFRPQGMVRIRVCRRGLDQPAGPAEERALVEIEKRLQDLGIRSGKSATLHSGSTNR